MRAFREDKTTSDCLFAFSHRDFVPDDSDVYLFCDLVDELNLSRFDAAYANCGEKPIAPRLMLRTILFGLCYGIVSGRKLEAACRYDNRFIVLSGDQKPDRRTIDRFLVRHTGVMADFFRDVVRLAQKCDLVGLGRLAIDGTKFKANTSKHKAMSYDYMVRAVETLETELADLRKSLAEENHEETTLDGTIPKEIVRREKRLAKIQAAKERLEAEARQAGKERPDEKAQKSFNDHDALPISNKGKDFFYGYNVQAAVDEKSQIVTGVVIHNSANDTFGLAPVLQESVANCEAAPAKVLADAAYGKAAANFSAIEETGAVPVIATGKGEAEGNQPAADVLEYDACRDSYRCPKGKIVFENDKTESGGREIKIPPGFCEGCSRSGECPLFCERGRSVSVPPEEHRAARRANTARMRTEEGKESYRRRKAIVEAQFGNVKWNRGFRLYVKGREKVRVRILVVFAAHNVGKIVKARKAA